MCLNSFLKASKGNNRISKSRAFHNVRAAYTKYLSKNELASVLLIEGTHNKQGSKDARVRIVVLLTLSLTEYIFIINRGFFLGVFDFLVIHLYSFMK